MQYVRISRQRLKRILLMIVIPVIVIFSAGVLYLKSGQYVETDDAYVQANMVPVSSAVSGIIKKVLVKENQNVSAGQPLFQLDPASFQNALNKSEASLAQVRSNLLALKASYRETQAEIQLAKTKYTYAKKYQKRQTHLLAKNDISTVIFDDAKQNTKLAKEQVTVLEKALARVAESIGGSISAKIESLPAYLEALAVLNQAKLNLSRVVVRASLPGTVSKLPKPGQYVATGSIAMILVVRKNMWVDANFLEDDLTYVHPGQRVTVHVDTYPDKTWTGEVESLSPATDSEFSVIPAQNATGNWVKISQRVSVRIKFNKSPNLTLLRAGLSTTVEIDTGHQRNLLGFVL